MKKKLLLGVMMFTMAGQMIVPSLQAAPASNAVQAASTASSNQNKGEIVQSVNLRTKPSTSSSIIRLVKTGESVTILDKPNSSWYKVKDTKGNTGYISSQSKYIRVGNASSGSNSPGNSNSSNDSSSTSPSKSGEIVQSVNLRTKPSTSSSIIRLVKTGESVTILDKPNSSWYKVKDTKGNTGYVSSQSKYIRVGNASSGPNSPGNSNSSNDSSSSSSSKSEKMDKVESVAKKYMGTPYEFGSDRNSTKTFDCSDFVRHVYKEALGIVLPADSRKQGAYIQDQGGVKKSISQLERGDLLFFMTYKGSSASSYKNVDKSKERITHVGMYLGNGKIIHTYSKDSGGVRVDDIRNTSWEYRFLFGGSVVK
ncbi:SH3 domain-containing C40 family peptidase [Paenibacillus alvei]|uniref:C40 family peptidase n=1 Tax=Paenibacillus alvei TaxID=44250 RepID=UPI0018CE9F11|nr:SH3 domain-containing C40 family peptidase [Paenibacillus alvei]MBG9737696.1 hydrolase Nlp/P60 [Paenibacillus alvei]MBG9747389.1 hydrolase Nlp/P60 [Paenibacillus alvei]MCY9542279.1 C40 family peptidase [Paenibacillus alvei]MCY9581102.1 C40 family peptidase [Paenibacillus alvei]MCY9707284.1 C40 family peptidase [Paenibacillus alvei]